MRSARVFALTALVSLLLAHAALAQERIHYIAADEVVWSYAPHHADLIAGKPLPPLSPAQLGWIYHKAIYREYSDASFTKVLGRSAQDRYEGLVGPTIHAEVGDTVTVVFRNHTQFPVDLAPAGLLSRPAATTVSPGRTVTYRWPIRAEDGPGPRDGSSVLYAYESNVDETKDQNAGLIGPLIVTRSGAARADGSPRDVDREIIALFSVQAEARSFLFPRNVGDPSVNPKHVSAKAFLLDLSNAFPTLNGFVFGNMPIPDMRRGQHVRWYLLSTQNDLDAHAPTWDGQTVISQGNRVDTVGLVTPHMVADMVPDNPGLWLVVCEFNVHLLPGLEARYRVLP